MHVVPTLLYTKWTYYLRVSTLCFLDPTQLQLKLNLIIMLFSMFHNNSITSSTIVSKAVIARRSFICVAICLACSLGSISIGTSILLIGQITGNTKDKDMWRFLILLVASLELFGVRLKIGTYFLSFQHFGCHIHINHYKKHVFFVMFKKRRKMSKKTGMMYTKHHLKSDQPKHAKHGKNCSQHGQCLPWRAHANIPVFGSCYPHVWKLTCPRLPTNISMLFTTSHSLWCLSTFHFPKCWYLAKRLRFLVASQKTLVSYSECTKVTDTFVTSVVLPTRAYSTSTIYLLIKDFGKSQNKICP